MLGSVEVGFFRLEPSPFNNLISMSILQLVGMRKSEQPGIKNSTDVGAAVMAAIGLQYGQKRETMS